MPLYDFLNTDTNEIFEKKMSIADKEQYLKTNPHIQSYFGNMAGLPLIDPVRLGIRKPDAGWTEVMNKIHNRTAGSQLDKTYNV